MTFKTIPITNDPKHPLYGLIGREIHTFEGILDRSPSTRTKIQHWLHEENCATCARCCKAGYFNGIVIHEDDHLVKLRLTNEDILPSDNGKKIYLDFANYSCQFLKENMCDIYLDRPRGCREFPFKLCNIEDDEVKLGIALADRCPITYELQADKITSILLSDIIFLVDDALKNPETYVPTYLLSKFIEDLQVLKKKGETYYISKILGHALIELATNYREGKTPYDSLPVSPFLLHQGNLFFLI